MERYFFIERCVCKELNQSLLCCNCESALLRKSSTTTIDSPRRVYGICINADMSANTNSTVVQLTDEESQLKIPRFSPSEIAINLVVKELPTRMGFEPTRAEHIGLAVQRLNHSATSSCCLLVHQFSFKYQVKGRNSQKGFPTPGVEPGPPG